MMLTAAGSLSRVRETVFTVAPGVSKIANINSSRVWIMFAVSSGPVCQFSTKSNVDANTGFQLGPTQSPQAFSLLDSIALCQQDWYVYNPAGTARVTVWEVDYRPEHFNAG